MNITTDPAQEVWHQLADPGAYEWWYFDAEDPSRGISIVCIWFSGFAFSPFYLRHFDRWRSRLRSDAPHPGQYAGFSFQLYEHGREVVNYMREGHDALSSFATDGVEVRFDRNAFIYDRERDEYRLSISFDFPARGLKVSGAFSFRPRHRYDYHCELDCLPGQGHRHQWLLCAPRADVEGSIDLEESNAGSVARREFTGLGYHDHNLGSMPMADYFRRWYWGRFFSERVDLVYYVVYFRNRECPPLSVMMLHDREQGRQRVVESVRFTERRMQKGLFAPLHGRELHLDAGSLSVGVSQRSVLDSGPFYLRYASTFSVRGEGLDLDGLEGISEFLDPAALHSPLMRFFTASRILRDGETTAMYRYYNYFKHRFDWLKTKKFSF